MTWPPVMLTVEVADLPATLRRFAEATLAAGWSVWATYSEAVLNGDQVATVAIRLGHGEHRCYGVWRLGETPTGKPSVKWSGGANRHRAFATLDALKSYAGIA